MRDSGARSSTDFTAADVANMIAQAMSRLEERLNSSRKRDKDEDNFSQKTLNKDVEADLWQ